MERVSLNVEGEWHQMLDLGPLVLAKKELRIKTYIQVEAYLENHRGRRSEL